MGNGGWYGTKEEWRRIEVPLLKLDQILESFASSHQLTITRNHKDWPERSIEWGGDVRCLIQMFLDDEHTLAVTLWICASQDRGHSRYWKQSNLAKAVQSEDLLTKLPNLLDFAKSELDRWSSEPETLEFATKLQS